MECVNELLENAQVVERVEDWQSALRLAAQPLLLKVNISEVYVTAMMDSVIQNGPYMVIGDEFALMHARPGEGVKQIGVSLLIVKQAVDVCGKPAKVFLVLAAVDNTSHLALLQELMTVFMDEDKFQLIKSGQLAQIKDRLKEEVK